MAGYDEFQAFKNYYVMDNESLDLASNYVCFQLNNPGIGYRYYYDMYSYITKCKIVKCKFYKHIIKQSLARPYAMASWSIF